MHLLITTIIYTLTNDFVNQRLKITNYGGYSIIYFGVLI